MPTAPPTPQCGEMAAKDGHTVEGTDDGLCAEQNIVSTRKRGHDQVEEEQNCGHTDTAQEGDGPAITAAATNHTAEEATVEGTRKRAEAKEERQRARPLVAKAYRQAMPPTARRRLGARSVFYSPPSPPKGAHTSLLRNPPSINTRSM